MRIAYVSLHWPRTKASGIGKKIERQLNAWRELGHETQFFSHLPTGEDENLLVDGARFAYTLHKGVLGLFMTEFERMRALQRLLLAVRNYQPQVIYLRWGMYVFPLHHLFSIAPVIVEINTNDVEEHKLLGVVKSTYNKLTRSITLGSAQAMIYSTRELAEHPAFTHFRKPGEVVSNSIDLRTIKPLPAPNNRPPHLLFIGTPGFAWHGVDKLVSLASTFPDLIVEVAGYDHLEGVLSPPANLKLHGYLHGAAYQALLAQADAAIGTLALHRKGMQEASPLKVRDCLAHGIPCILPYVDTDLSDLPNDMIMTIPNSEDNVLTHGQRIHDFVLKARGQRVVREVILPRIDSLIKESRRLDFMSKWLA